MILTHHLVISDAGGSVIIHMFGCYFGLAVAKALERDETTKEESPKESSSYNSDLIAMLGKRLFHNGVAFVVRLSPAPVID